MVIVLTGPAGAGKSTVGGQLAEALGWPFHDGDDFHPPANVARMRAGLPLRDEDRGPWLDALAALIARAGAEQRSAVVACSALRREYRRRLAPDAATARAVRFVYLRVPPLVLAARLDARAGHYFAASLLASQLAALEEPDADEPAPVLTLDAAVPPETLVACIVDALGAGLDAARASREAGGRIG